MHRAEDPDEAWAALDEALRSAAGADPDPSLRARCLPPGLAAEPPPARHRVLVVDDEPNIRRLIEVHLTRAGYEVVTAKDGEEALVQVHALRPDLIVLDVLMPRVSGLQVLQALKDDPRTADIQVLLLTARSTDDHIRQGWQEGTDMYLTKPFNPEELRRIVDGMAAVLGTPENPPPLRRWLK